MLQELRVRNYALLDNVQVHFKEGMTALTGETGAGKSLLVGALGLILGEKTNLHSIRYGADEAEVIGVVKIQKQENLRTLLKENDIFLDEDILELRRVVRVKGSSAIYANGVRITRDQLAAITSLIFDMHGQHEHQSLYSQENQRILLDRSAGITEKVHAFAQEFILLKHKKEELRLLEEKLIQMEEERVYRERSLVEIEQLNPSQEDKEQLLELSVQLEDSERIQELLGQFQHSVRGNSGLILKLKDASNTLRFLSDINSKTLKDRLEGAILEIEDISDSFVEVQEQFMRSPQELERIQTRLMEYQRLEKKYGAGNLIGLLKYYRNAQETHLVLQQSDEAQETLRKYIKELEQKLRLEAQNISKQRESAATVLETQVHPLLVELSLPNAQFKVEVSARKNRAGERVIGSTGVDEVRFLFSANVGEPLKPLKDVASGGEISRVLLILKSVLAHQEEIDCLIFDEIDTGIGGQVALNVAKHLRVLSKNKQILCITHLASIAACAQSQLKIEKEVVDDHTRTIVREISSQLRVDEIARMLSGSLDVRALEHARLLLGFGAEEEYGKKECNQL